MKEEELRCDCGNELKFDPFTRIWYCRTCDPQFHAEVERDMREERVRKVREEYLNTVMDNM